MAGLVLIFRESVEAKVAEKSLKIVKMRRKNGKGTSPQFFHIAMKNNHAKLLFPDYQKPWRKGSTLKCVACS